MHQSSNLGTGGNIQRFFAMQNLDIHHEADAATRALLMSGCIDAPDVIPAGGTAKWYGGGKGATRSVHAKR